LLIVRVQSPSRRASLRDAPVRDPRNPDLRDAPVRDLRRASRRDDPVRDPSRVDADPHDLPASPFIVRVPREEVVV